MYKGIIFIGGGDYRKKETIEIDKRIVKLVSSNARFLFIPFAVKEKEKRESRINSVIETYKELGVRNFETLDEYSTSKDTLKKQIEDSDILFITGGDPRVLLSTLGKYNLKNSIKKFNGYIIGFSAGAMILPSNCIIPAGMDETYPSSVILRGLDIVNFSVIPHYSKIIDRELLSLSDKKNIFAVPNSSALFYLNNKASLLGDIFLFHNNRKKRIKRFPKLI